MAPRRRGGTANAAQQPKRPAAAPPSSRTSSSTKGPAKPRALSPRARRWLVLALPLTVAGFAAGVAGMLILLNPGHPLASTRFGTSWRVVLSKNLFVQPFLFNFGAIASVAVAARLVEDRRAALLRRLPAAGGGGGGGREQPRRRGA